MYTKVKVLLSAAKWQKTRQMLLAGFKEDPRLSRLNRNKRGVGIGLGVNVNIGVESRIKLLTWDITRVEG